MRQCETISLWSVDDGKTCTTLHVPPGCYELKAINAEIIRYKWKQWHYNSSKCQHVAIYIGLLLEQCILTVVGAIYIDRCWSNVYRMWFRAMYIDCGWSNVY